MTGFILSSSPLIIATSNSRCLLNFVASDLEMNRSLQTTLPVRGWMTRNTPTELA